MSSDLLWSGALMTTIVALGLWNRKRNRVVVTDPSVLVLDLASEGALAASDSREYQKHFAHVTESTSLDSLRRTPVDVLHVIASLGADGRMGTHALAEFHRAVAAAHPTVVIVASENASDVYRQAFLASGPCPYNLVMTLSREGTKFWTFLHRLFELMFRGHSMPVAWAKLAPQGAADHTDAPSAIFVPGAGQVMFRKTARAA